MYTNCVGGPNCLTDFGDPSAEGLPLSTLKGQPAQAEFRGGVDPLSAFGAEDIVDIANDVLEVHHMCYVLPF